MFLFPSIIFISSCSSGVPSFTESKYFRNICTMLDWVIIVVFTISSHLASVVTPINLILFSFSLTSSLSFLTCLGNDSGKRCVMSLLHFFGLYCLSTHFSVDSFCFIFFFENSCLGFLCRGSFTFFFFEVLGSTVFS